MFAHFEERRQGHRIFSLNEYEADRKIGERGGWRPLFENTLEELYVLTLTKLRLQLKGVVCIALLCIVNEIYTNLYDFNRL